jgi:hypothetical protein
MSEKDKHREDPEDATERELIEMEFQSMVENLSLDESTPSSYLDELDAISDSEKFLAPNPAKKSSSQSFRDAIAAFKKWKNGKDFRDDDGVAL